MRNAASISQFAQVSFLPRGARYVTAIAADDDTCRQCPFQSGHSSQAIQSGTGDVGRGFAGTADAWIALVPAGVLRAGRKFKMPAERARHAGIERKPTQGG